MAGSSPVGSTKGMRENMKYRWTMYILYIFILFISLYFAQFVVVSDILRNIASVPGIGALFLLLAQLWRDNLAHQRTVELQNSEQDFVLGTASHMAQVVYDKHVVFCEEYMERLQEGFQNLMRDGATKEALNFGGDLVRIRLRHSAWLTTDMEVALKPFELGLINMGAKEHRLALETNSEARTRLVGEIYEIFGLILGDNKPKTEEESLLALQKPIDYIRRILGIDAMTALRQKASDLALKRLSA